MGMSLIKARFPLGNCPAPFKEKCNLSKTYITRPKFQCVFKKNIHRYKNSDYKREDKETRTTRP